MKYILLFLLLPFLGTLSAQDAYHTALSDLLQTTHGLPVQQAWLLPNTESATLGVLVNYGGSTTNTSPSGQIFTVGRQRVVTQGNNPWDAGHFYPNQTALASGDKCLLVMWMRSPTAGAKASLFAENASTFAKDAFVELNLGDEWTMYAVPFAASSAFAVGSLNFGLHLAWSSQTVEIAGAACLNYKNTVQLDELPVLLGDSGYDGIAPDAPWRAEAAASIEQLRKANLTVTVLGPNGLPENGVPVRVEMLQHEFKFGTAVVSNRFNGGSAQSATYESKLLDLDGEGHGFNEVVFENDLKWPAWEQHWFSSQAQIASDVAWLLDHGISVRGHNLVWPGWTYSPPDIHDGQSPDFIKNRMNAHIEDILSYPGVGTACADWDAINEVTKVTDYADHFAGTPGYVTGREIYPEIFELAKSLAPNSTLYLNDYVAIEQADSPSNGIATWRSRIDEIIAAGAPLEAIGFQGHFSASPTGIPRVKEVLDEFWTAYGLPAKVTEYDIDKLVPADVQAQYMRDILSICFAHPSMRGFLMWGFWDGAHWQGNAPIYKEDWTLKPSGEAFIDQVFNLWWTDETVLSTNSDFTLGCFKGKYRVTAQCPDGNTFEQLLDLTEDASITLETSCVVGTEEADAAAYGLRILPNPAQGFFVLEWNAAKASAQEVLVQVWRTDGALMHEEKTAWEGGSLRVSTEGWAAGAYTVTLRHSEGWQVSRVVQVGQ